MSSVFDVLTEEVRFRLHSTIYALNDRSRHTPQTVLVNGSPKTGTTWMIKLITSVPGYHAAGNFNGDIKKYASTSPGDVIHGHDTYSEELNELLLPKQIRVILMLRDPRDQAVSRVFHLKRDTNNSFHSAIEQMDTDEALMACIEGRPGLRSVLHMLSLNQSWLNSKREILCVRYEDLIADPYHQLQKVFEFLGIPAHENFIQLIIDRNRFERLTIGKKIWKRGRSAGQEDNASHFRKGIVGDWKNYFTDDHKKRFKEIAGPVLIEMGYEQNPNW